MNPLPESALPGNAAWQRSDNACEGFRVAKEIVLKEEGQTKKRSRRKKQAKKK